MRIRFAIAPWKTMRVPTQIAVDKLLEATCDQRTKASRERIQKITQRRPWNTVRV